MGMLLTIMMRVHSTPGPSPHRGIDRLRAQNCQEVTYLVGMTACPSDPLTTSVMILRGTSGEPTWWAAAPPLLSPTGVLRATWATVPLRSWWVRSSPGLAEPWFHKWFETGSVEVTGWGRPTILVSSDVSTPTSTLPHLQPSITLLPHRFISISTNLI